MSSPLFYLLLFPLASPYPCHNVIKGLKKVAHEAMGACVHICVCVRGPCGAETSGFPIAMRARGSPGNLIGMCFLAGLIVASPNHCPQP